MIQSLRRELANNRGRHLQELDQALQDAERRAQQPSPVYAAASTQPYATPVEKKTLHAVVAVAQAAPMPAFHTPGLSPGASAGNLNIKSRNKGSSTMVVPVRRRLRTKTPPAAAQRVPSMGLVRRRMRSKGPPHWAPRLSLPAGSEECHSQEEGGDPPAGQGQPGSNARLLAPPGLPLQQPSGRRPGDSGGDSKGDSGGDD